MNSITKKLYSVSSVITVLRSNSTCISKKSFVMMKAACLLRARAEKKREQNEVGEGRIGGPRQVARWRWLKKDSNSGCSRY